MREIYDGKTKTLYLRKDGNLVLKFKDHVTGEGDRIDPGSNSVIGEIEGKGKASLALSAHIFRMLSEKGIPTHYVDADPDTGTMVVRAADRFGSGLEFICRLKAYGSFIRRYGAYAKELDDLDYLVEITLKDDERGDPPVNEDTLVQLRIMTWEELEEAKRLTRQVTKCLEEHLRSRLLDLIDLKLEFGSIEGQVTVIDEVSGDCMRVMDGQKRLLLADELAEKVLK